MKQLTTLTLNLKGSRITSIDDLQQLKRLNAVKLDLPWPLLASVKTNAPDVFVSCTVP